jgi:hypothetical protein
VPCTSHMSDVESAGQVLVLLIPFGTITIAPVST